MGKKKRDNNFFWIGYSDLMTTLFFVMLVLFAVVFISANPDELVRLKNENKELLKSLEIARATEEEYRKILQINEQFAQLEDDPDFIYLENCKKYIAKELLGEEIFESGKVEIQNKYIESTVTIGKKIQKFLDELERENRDLSYLLVIEGNMANTFDRKYNKDNLYGFKTSYDRALAVYNLWSSKGISFRKSNVEVIISGSGFNGVCRDPVEENNKRFSIQIIPKVSPIKSSIND